MKTSSKKSDEDEDDEDIDDGPDDWESPEEEEEWDPDFEEFDVPKSKGKKTAGKRELMMTMTSKWMMSSKIYLEMKRVLMMTKMMIINSAALRGN